MENQHMSIKSQEEVNQRDFDYDMVYVTKFYYGKLWVVWREVTTGNTLTSEFEEIGYDKNSTFDMET